MMDRDYKHIFKRSILVFYFALLIMSFHPVYAYMDPGSGSLFVQLVFGGAAGFGVALKLYWRNIVNAQRARRSESTHSKSQES